MFVNELVDTETAMPCTLAASYLKHGEEFADVIEGQ